MSAKPLNPHELHAIATGTRAHYAQRMTCQSEFQRRVHDQHPRLGSNWLTELPQLKPVNPFRAISR
jgi:hypothetical protein